MLNVMNPTLFRQTWRFQKVRLALVSIALAVWGFLLPVIYARFGSQFSALMNSGLLPEEFAKFGGVAGERQRGTLEVALARPISRQSFYLTLLAASFVFVATTIAALLAGGVGGAVFAGVAGELAFEKLPLLWLNGVLLFGAFAAIGLAASISFDRFPTALGWALGIVITMYVMQVLGSLWPAAEKLQPYSLFYYLKPKPILTGAAEPMDLGVLAVVIVSAMAWALVVFPRRDLAAPS
jgi:ABC-type transport system involved in multi-copper enzyme maturation permease subunit